MTTPRSALTAFMPYDTASGSISTGCGLGGGVVLDGQRRPFELDEYLGSAAAVATQSVYSSGGPPAANPIPVATDAFRMTTTFADLFDRAAEYDVTVDAVGAALAERRSVSQGDADTSTEGGSNASDTDDLPCRPRSESGPRRRRRRRARGRPLRRRAGSRGARRAALTRVDDSRRQRPAPRRRRGSDRRARKRRTGGRLARSGRGVARASGAVRGRPSGAGVSVPRRERCRS